WSLNNPILSSGETGVELDTNRIKIGDGISDWNSLFYMLGNISGLQLTIGNGQVNSLYWDIAERLDILGSGDTAVFFDNFTNSITIYSSGSSLGSITGALGYVPQQSGNYSIVGHLHNIGDISGLQTSLNSKQSTGVYASGLHFHQITDVSGLVNELNSKQIAGLYSPLIHSHPIYISNGSNRVISYNTGEDLIIAGSGNTSVFFNDASNSIIISSNGVDGGNV
ncbi:MAG: hypothetical protein WD512_18715, partial [Candidatus Paceibacterota bacterium]